MSPAHSYRLQDCTSSEPVQMEMQPGSEEAGRSVGEPEGFHHHYKDHHTCCHGQDVEPRAVS